MKVKIGNKMHDSKEEPVIVILSKKEKELIANMSPDDFRFCSFPKGSKPADIDKWMTED